MKDNQLKFEEWNTGVSRTQSYGLLTDEDNPAGISVHGFDINGKEYPAKETAHLIVATWNSYTKNCGDRAVECAESDLLGECLEVLKTLESCGAWYLPGLEIDVYDSDINGEELHESIKSILSKRKD